MGPPAGLVRRRTLPTMKIRSDRPENFVSRIKLLSCALAPKLRKLGLNCSEFRNPAQNNPGSIVTEIGGGNGSHKPVGDTRPAMNGAFSLLARCARSIAAGLRRSGAA